MKFSAEHQIENPDWFLSYAYCGMDDSFVGKFDQVQISRDLQVFTDGSCHPNPGPGGWAFVVYQDGREVHSDWGFDANTTNNRMEMMGVLRAMQWLNGRQAQIFSDSQYVVNGLNAWSIKWAKKGWKIKGEPVKNGDLWKTMRSCMNNQYKLSWVRGHNGTEGNERADELAEMARLCVKY